MAKHRSVAWIRGINVGGHHRVKMVDLVAIFEKLGFTEIATYVQSGNVVFSSTRKPACAEIEDAMEKKLGFASSVVLRSKAEIEKVVAGNPYPAECADGAKVHVIFGLGTAKNVSVKGQTVEKFVVAGNDAYVHYPDGAGRSKLQLFLGTPMTARNWNTILAVLALL